MPYLPTDQLEDDKDKASKETQSGSQGSSPENISGSTNVASNAVSSGAGSGSAGPNKSGTYADLNEYLDANQEQGARMVGDVANSISQSGDTAKQWIDNASAGFNSAVNASAPAVQNAGLIDSAAADPTKFVSDASNVANFKALQNPYAGPSDFTAQDGYGDAQSKSTGVVQKLDNAKTEAGRMQLLQSQYATPNYTNGQQLLDQMLFENSNQTGATFQSLQDKYAGLNDYMTAANQTAAQHVNDAKSAQDASAQKIQQTFLDPNAGLQATLQKQIADQFAAYNSTRESQAADETKLFNSDAGNQSFLDALGIQPGHLYNLNLNDYIQDNGAADINKTTTADQAARAAALQTLVGGTNQITNSTLAGQQTNPFSFDASKFAADQTNRQSLASDYSQNLSAAQNYWSNLYASLGGGGEDPMMWNINSHMPQWAPAIAAAQANVGKYANLLSALNPDRMLTGTKGT